MGSAAEWHHQVARICDCRVAYLDICQHHTPRDVIGQIYSGYVSLPHRERLIGEIDATAVIALLFENTNKNTKQHRLRLIKSKIRPIWTG